MEDCVFVLGGRITLIDPLMTLIVCINRSVTSISKQGPVKKVHLMDTAWCLDPSLKEA